MVETGFRRGQEYTRAGVPSPMGALAAFSMRGGWTRMWQKLGLCWTLGRILGAQGTPCTGQNAPWCRASAGRVPNGGDPTVWEMGRRHAHVGTWVEWVWDPRTGSHVLLVTGPRGGRLLLRRDCGLPCVAGGGSSFPPEVLSWRVLLHLLGRDGRDRRHGKQERLISVP